MKDQSRIIKYKMITFLSIQYNRSYTTQRVDAWKVQSKMQFKQTDKHMKIGMNNCQDYLVIGKAIWYTH